MIRFILHLRPRSFLILQKWVLATASKTIERGRLSIHSSSYVRKWAWIAPVIGVVAGLGAVLFYNSLTIATHFFLNYINHYQIPLPGGEGANPGSGSFTRPLLIPVVVTIGAIGSGFLVSRFAPEAKGHGTDAAISAVFYHPKGIRVRAVIVKIFASALTIGSGGSGGREGPTGQISAGFGSLLSKVLRLSNSDSRIAVSSGIGSGIGAIFGAPFGGALLACDILYRDDFDLEAFLPALIASAVAYAIFGTFEGYSPIFTYDRRFTPHSFLTLLAFAVLGIFAGGFGILYSKIFWAANNFFDNIKLPLWVKTGAGGLGVGIIALFIPEVLGTGYGWIQISLDSSFLKIPLWVVLIMPLARILATALSIGSGGSGGIFGPGMVIGAFLGAAFWRVFEPLAPFLGSDPAPYVVVAMAACFGSIARAPIAVTVMVLEMTGNISILEPVVIAVAVATAIVTHFDLSIYEAQLRNRTELKLRLSSETT